MPRRRWHRPYGLGVSTTGVIFAAIAIAWIAYLVPHFARNREGDPVEEEAAPIDRFSESMRIVRHGTAPLLDQDLTEIGTLEVSTPQTRRAAVNELRRLEDLAASRRRRVLLILLAVLSLTVGFCAVSWLPWWATYVAGGLVVGFFVLARVSVRAMCRSLDGRYAEINAGGKEKTVFLSRKDLTAPAEDKSATASTVQAAKTGGLWDPVPITMPTYVSKPLAPRTVRTIDLSGPGVTSSARHPGPVTADAPQAPAEAEAVPAAEEQQTRAASA